MKTDNELIAEFMGTKVENCHTHVEGRRYSLLTKNFPRNLKYHCSWSELMPVVEKISLIDIPDIFEISSLTIFAHIDSVYKAVIEFIKWHNQFLK